MKCYKCDKEGLGCLQFIHESNGDGKVYYCCKEHAYEIAELTGITLPRETQVSVRYYYLWRLYHEQWKQLPDGALLYSEEQIKAFGEMLVRENSIR